jgi:tRNA A37 threonylcarbamoyltransferase TsaD
MQAAVPRPLYIVPSEFATDNAAMIGSAAYYVPDVWYEADIEPGLAL